MARPHSRSGERTSSSASARIPGRPPPSSEALVPSISREKPSDAARSLSRENSPLSCLGFRDFRLRLGFRGAKLQLLEGQLPLVLERRTDILNALEAAGEQPRFPGQRPDALFGQAALPQRGADLQPRAPID